MMALVPDTRTPAERPSQEIVIDLMMVTAPKPPGSMQLISPAAAVFEIAPAKVLQGAVRLQGLASSPTPETQVRVAWALAGAAAKNGSNEANKANKTIRRMRYLLGLTESNSRPVKISISGCDANIASPQRKEAKVARKPEKLGIWR